MPQFWFLCAMAVAMCLASQGGAFWIHMGDTPDFDLHRSRPAYVTMQYSVQGGIFNQHMDHCQTLMLAVALKAQRMLWVPSLDRDTYSVVFNRQRWHLIEAHEIYDMDSITAMASDVGIDIEVQHVDTYRLPPTHMQSYITLWDPVRGRGYGRLVNIDMVVRKGRQNLEALARHINEKIESLLEASGNTAEVLSVRVVLDTPFAMLAYAPKSIARPVLRAVAFAPYLTVLADQALDAMHARTGSTLFSGIHLRIEPDAKGMREWMAGTAAVEALYDEAMTHAGFDSSQTLYVASGLLSLSAEHSSNVTQVMDSPWFHFCQQRSTDVFIKDMLLPLDALQALGNEHKAVLDFLVLMRASRVVGFLGSTFSQQLRLYRALAGVNMSTMFMVGDIAENEHTAEVQAVIDVGLLAEEARRAATFKGSLHDTWKSIQKGNSLWALLRPLALMVALVFLPAAIIRKCMWLTMPLLHREFWGKLRRSRTE